MYVHKRLWLYLFVFLVLLVSIVCLTVCVILWKYICGFMSLRSTVSVRVFHLCFTVVCACFLCKCLRIWYVCMCWSLIKFVCAYVSECVLCVFVFVNVIKWMVACVHEISESLYVSGWMYVWEYVFLFICVFVNVVMCECLYLLICVCVCISDCVVVCFCVSVNFVFCVCVQVCMYASVYFLMCVFVSICLCFY